MSADSEHHDPDEGSGETGAEDEGPVVTAVTPAQATIRGGTEIAIAGRNFQPGCTLSLLGQHSPEVLYESTAQLRFVAPAHPAPETGLLSIQNPDGLRCAQPAAFAYVAPLPPRIEAVTPADGSTAGGKRITISGDGFQPGCSVHFGSSPGTVVQGDAGTLLVSLPTAAEPGLVDVVVTNPDAQAARASGAFSYERPPAPPKIISVAPNRGYCAGGTQIAVTGDNFDERTVLRVGEVQASIERRTRTELTALTPPHEAEGSVAVEVVNRVGVPVRLENAFTYERRPAPTIEDVEPRVGSTIGGTQVVIEGANLGSDMKVRIGRERAKLLRARGTTVLEIVTPIRRSAGLVDLEVIGPDGSVAVAKKAFKYEPYPKPVVSSVSPNRCGTAGGTELCISGDNFAEGAAVFLGRTQLPKVKRVDETTLEIKVPPGKHGQMFDVEVRNVDGGKGILRRAFAYDQRYE